MSGKIAGLVWQLKLPAPEKFVLLAYADHAHHDGTGIRPKLSTIAEKTDRSERHVQRMVHTLREKGLLVLVANERYGKGNVPEYRIPLDMLPKDDVHVTFCPSKDDTGVTFTDSKGDAHDAFSLQKVTRRSSFALPKGDVDVIVSALKGDTGVTPPIRTRARLNRPLRKEREEKEKKEKKDPSFFSPGDASHGGGEGGSRKGISGSDLPAGTEEQSTQCDEVYRAYSTDKSIPPQEFQCELPHDHTGLHTMSGMRWGKQLDWACADPNSPIPCGHMTAALDLIETKLGRRPYAHPVLHAWIHTTGHTLEDLALMYDYRLSKETDPEWLRPANVCSPKNDYLALAQQWAANGRASPCVDVRERAKTLLRNDGVIYLTTEVVDAKVRELERR